VEKAECSKYLQDNMMNMRVCSDLFIHGKKGNKAAKYILDNFSIIVNAQRINDHAYETFISENIRYELK
jgi:hypothetical protein